MNHADELDVELLEPLLRDFVSLIGLRATMAIVGKHGGCRLNIAHKADENAQLVALIGRQAAAILGQNYGGERPLIPKAQAALQAVRDARIRAESATKSARQQAIEHAISERRIWQIRGDRQDPTGDLFA